MGDTEVAYVKKMLIEEQVELERLDSIVDSSSVGKFNCLNNIIDFKKLINYKGSESIYLDFKRYFTLYIESISEKDSGYESIKVDRVYKKLDGFSHDQKATLMSTFKRCLKGAGFVSEADKCEQYIDQETVNHLYSKGGFKRRFRGVVIWSALCVDNLLISLFVIFLFTSVLLWPAPVDCMAIFKTKTELYCNNEIVNHMLNVLTLFFDLDSGMKAQGLNVFGVILIILGKAGYIILLLNYLIKALIKRINIID